MSNRNRTAVDIDSVHRDRKLAQTNEHLHSKGLIDLEQINFTERMARFTDDIQDRFHRSDKQLRRFTPSGRGCHDTAERPLARSFTGGLISDDDRCGTIADHRSIAGGYSPRWVECRLQCGQTLKRAVAARA